MLRVDDDGTVVVLNEEGRERRYASASKRPPWPGAYLHLTPGDEFPAGAAVIASAVPPADVECEGATWDWRSDLLAVEPDDRYAAVKAARYAAAADRATVAGELAALAEQDDWRVGLEAMGVLALQNAALWVARIEAVAGDDEAAAERRMEAIFILSELHVGEAVAALTRLAATPSCEPEVRAAAAWGLGTGVRPSSSGLLGVLDDQDDRVALHAAAALPAPLEPDVVAALVSWVRAGNTRQQAVAAFVLARHGSFQELVGLAREKHAAGRLYALHALGRVARTAVEDGLGEVPPDLAQPLELLWLRHEDWLEREGNTGAVDVLDAQKLRTHGEL